MRAVEAAPVLVAEQAANVGASGGPNTRATMPGLAKGTHPRYLWGWVPLPLQKRGHIPGAFGHKDLFYFCDKA